MADVRDFPYQACGDVNRESIKGIWKRRNSDLVEKHMSHQWDKLPEICSGCNDWMVVGEQRFDEDGNVIDKNYDSKHRMMG